MTPDIRWVQITYIRRDAITQARVGLNMEQVQRYKEAKLAGAVFPPSVVFEDGAGVLWLADGFHRVAADDAMNAATTQVEVRKGERRDAWKHALGANAEHGLPRTRDDMRRAVRMALEDPELGRLSNREIAAICKVSHEFVRRRRNDLGSTEEADTCSTERDPWEGETDPDQQRQRLLSESDPVRFEILLGAAHQDIREEKHGVRRFLNDLYWVRRCKTQAELADRFSVVTADGLRQAILQRSAELADQEGDPEAGAATTVREFVAALAHNSLGSDRASALLGLVVAGRLRMKYGYINPDHLRGIPENWAIHAAAARREGEKLAETAGARATMDNRNRWFRQLQADDELELADLPPETAWQLMDQIQSIPHQKRKGVIARLHTALAAKDQPLEFCLTPRCIEEGYFTKKGGRCPNCYCSREHKLQHLFENIQNLCTGMTVWPPDVRHWVLQQLLDPDLLAMLESVRQAAGQIDHTDIEAFWITNEANPLPTLAVGMQAWLSGAGGRVIARPRPKANADARSQTEEATA